MTEEFLQSIFYESSENMKIACTADWHIHQFQEFSKQIRVSWKDGKYVPDETGKEMNSRLVSILNGLCEMRDYCIQNSIKCVLNAGDTFHKRGTINVDTFNAAYKVIESFYKADLALISIAGNHDQVDSSDIPATSIHTLNKIQTVIERPAVVTYSGCKIVAIPYSTNKAMILDKINKLQGDILLLHCGITGSVVGSGNYLMTDEYTLDDLQPDKWKYVVVGHYHKPQILAPNVFYCGTPTQKTFGDEILEGYSLGQYNGFFVIDTDIPNKIEFKPIHQPRFITIYDLEDIPENSVDFIRMKVPESADIENIPQDIKVEIEKNYTKTARSTVSLSDNIATMVRKYAEENDADEETTQLGLSILSETLLESE